MKWFSNLPKKARTALLVGAWVLAVAVIVVVASLANGATLPWWAALVLFVAVIPALTLTICEVRSHAPKSARQGETPNSTASASAEGKRPLEGLSFCLAGEYNWAHKDIYALIRDCGGTVEAQPNRNLSFMLDDDGADSLNSKTLTALRLQRNGSRVQIVPLGVLLVYLSGCLDVEAWFAEHGYHTMKNAVIYARFSSQGQNEQSIESQIRICTEYAEENGYSVVEVYKDKARTGTNDSRPDFQHMIKDAASGKFEFIIVYMFDRFARNRRDSIMYKEMLKQDYGIRVISATQPISDDEGGEFYEMFLEWNDEKYSKRLSKRVKNGLDTSVENGTFCGGYLVYGYKLRQEPIAGKRNKFMKYVEIDEEQAEIIRYAFTEYDKGTDKKEIAATLNARGARYNGKPFKGRTFDKWLNNAKYTGEFYFGERLCTNTYPAIIDKDLFERVQKRLQVNRYFAGGTATARVPYLLTGKAFCAHCLTPMISDGGTSHTGQQHHYYACKGKKKGVCEKRREDKDTLELFVTQVVYDFLSDKENVSVAVRDTLAYYAKRTGADSIKSIDGKIAKVQKDIEEMTTAFIEAKNALLRANIEKRMNDYEKLIEDLQSQKAQLERERGRQFTEKDFMSFIADLLKGDPNDKEYQRKIIDNLVIKVFVGDGFLSAHLRIGNATEVEDIRLEEVKKALEHIFSVQTLSPLARQKNGRFCPFFTIFKPF